MSAPGGSAPRTLPTLLTSRPQLPPDGKSICPDVQLQSKLLEAQPRPRLPEAYAMPICVRNTFIDTLAELSPSLAGLHREREVSTCPSAHVGRLRGLFEEPGAGGCGRDDDGAETRPPSEDPETRPASEASPSSAAAPPACVISLAGLLGPPSPPPAPAWGGEATPSSAVGDAAGCAGEGSWEGACHRGPSFWSAALPGQDVVLAPPAPPPVLVGELPAVPAPPEGPAPGSAELPSVGSAGHSAGCCKPCAFFHTQGCTSGLSCQFCHLCDADERKRRRRAKYEARRADRLRRAREAADGREEEVAGSS